MSYSAPKYGDDLENYFTRLSDFYDCAPHLLTCATKFEFLLWFEKCRTIDPRSLYLYIKKHRKEIPDEYIKYVQYLVAKDL